MSSLDKRAMPGGARKAADLRVAPPEISLRDMAQVVDDLVQQERKALSALERSAR